MFISPKIRPQATRPLSTPKPEAVQLTRSEGEPMHPKVSPDGQTVVYAAGTTQPLLREVYTVDLEGQEQKQLTNRVVNLSWQPAVSPDGKKIAYVVEKQGNSDLQVMNLDGTGNRNITDTNKGYWSPAWSPDGKYIVTTSRDTVRGNLELVAVAADGSSKKQVTNLGLSTDTPTFAPDGKHIVFGVSPGFGSPVLASIKPDGSDFKAYATDLVLIGTPTVSPDNQVVFSATRGDGKFGIYGVDLNSDAPASLLVDSNFGLSPTFSPDGSHFAFVDSDAKGNLQIFEADADGTDVHMITDQGRSNSSPAYTPDGEAIVFVSSRDGGREVYLQDIQRKV